MVIRFRPVFIVLIGSVNVSQLDELGEYITKLALELRFSKSEDGNLDGLHPLVAEEQGKLYAERTRLEDMNGSIGSTTDTNKRSKEEVRRKSGEHYTWSKT